jgi:hypothetical protein
MLNENQVFWLNLEKIKDSLLLDDQEFSKSLGLPYENYIKSKGKSEFLPVDCVFEFAEKLNFHFEDLLSIDFKIKLPNSNIQLLDRYAHATYSHTKPIINIVNYLETVRGHRAKINLLRKFQLSEEFIIDENHKTNIFLITDIVEHLKHTYRFGDKEFLAMGQRTPFVTENNFLKEKLTGHESVQHMFSRFFEECTHVFDKNCTYRLDSLTNEYAIVAAIPKKEVLEELEIRPHQFASANTALTRCGVISSMTWFQFRQHAPTRRIASIYNGDKYDRYLFELGPFKSKLRRKNSTLRQLPIYH